MPALFGAEMPAGPVRALVVVYLVFAISALGRSSFQIATRLSEAPVAYLLSALAAAVYVVAALALARGQGGRRLAIATCTFELAGVLAVGALTVADPSIFGDATVWSEFGIGYGFLPLVLPLLGLAWLRYGITRTAPA